MQLFENKFLTCMYSLRNNMYNCMICFFFKNKFYVEKTGTQKCQHMQCIGFFWIVVLTSLDECKCNRHGICCKSTFMKQPPKSLATHFYRLVKC